MPAPAKPEMPAPAKPEMPAPAKPEVTYWLGRKPDPARNEMVFDVRVPADLAALITCSDPRYAAFQRTTVQQFDWQSGDRQHTLLRNQLAWNKDGLDAGQLYLMAFGRQPNDTTKLATSDPDWAACKDVLLAQSVDRGASRSVFVTILKGDGTTKPELRINLDRPLSVSPGGSRNKHLHIVGVVQKKQLYIGWQTYGEDGFTPSGRIMVHKIATDALEAGKLSTVREVPSLGILVGFTVDETGADYVLTTGTDTYKGVPVGNGELPRSNNKEENQRLWAEFHKQWRKNVLLLHKEGKVADLNSDRYTSLPFYGVTGGGSGRLAVGPTHVAAVFARAHYTPGDNLVHQEANDFLAFRNLTQVGIKAGNTVSHSFDQRLIFDGKDFIALHKGDSYPYAGLIIEKLVTQRPLIARANAFACPTIGNSVYFDLGGLAAEADGYPILFTATRNTSPASKENEGKLNALPYDLALVYVVRNFEAKPGPKNPYDTLSSGILANGYAPDQDFSVDNFTWNPAASQFNNKEQRHIRRRVLWLTENGPNTRAMNAKLVKLRDGQYIALWDEQSQKSATRAMTITIQGPATSKTITKGEPVELKLADGPGGAGRGGAGGRLPAGDDAFSITINGQPRAAWLTAGSSPQQFLLHTVDGELAYKAYPLTLP